MGADTAWSEHHEHRPSPALAPWVERAVGYRLAGFAAGTHVGMPSGTVTLVVPLDEPLVLSGPGLAPRTGFGAVLGGLTAAPVLIHHDGSQHGIQLALRPSGLRRLLGVRAGDLASACVELSDVIGPAAGRLRDRLHETPSWSDRFALVEQALTVAAASPRHHRPRDEVREAWRLIGATGGTVQVRRVAEAVGWSTRRLQHEFAAEYGLSPKTACRVRRFERSVPLVAGGAVPLTQVALRCGWSDHAHMDRDWRALAGTSPTAWLRDDALAERRD